METKANISLKVLWIIITLHILTTTSKIIPTPRIAGGDAINITEAKFMVQVIAKDRCGGSLITPLHVITAAHCVSGVQPSELAVIGGATYLYEDGLRRYVDTIYLPREYENIDSPPDIAVLRLSSPLRGPNVATIELCNTQWQEGALFKVYGWGATHKNDFFNIFLPIQLRMVEVPALATEKCEELYENISSKMLFCAGVHGEKDSCSGDSGGPAVYNNQLCGIVSQGPSCPQIGLYVNINYFRDFVEKILQLDGE